jgi:hypothetical protein
MSGFNVSNCHAVHQTFLLELLLGPCRAAVHFFAGVLQIEEVERRDAESLETHVALTTKAG